MVRLKVYVCQPLISTHLFQFHYGTIKSCLRNVSGRAATLFQFHYGTIKRTPLMSPDKLMSLFQFHYGTIKRGESPPERK